MAHICPNVNVLYIFSKHFFHIVDWLSAVLGPNEGTEVSQRSSMYSKGEPQR